MWDLRGPTPINLNSLEYAFLRGEWEGYAGAAFNAIGEFMIEEGYMDHFGIVTPSGQKAIERYEKQQKEKGS